MKWNITNISPNRCTIAIGLSRLAPGAIRRNVDDKEITNGVKRMAAAGLIKLEQIIQQIIVDPVKNKPNIVSKLELVEIKPEIKSPLEDIITPAVEPVAAPVAEPVLIVAEEVVVAPVVEVVVAQEEAKPVELVEKPKRRRKQKAE